MAYFFRAVCNFGRLSESGPGGSFLLPLPLSPGSEYKVVHAAAKAVFTTYSLPCILGCARRLISRKKQFRIKEFSEFELCPVVFLCIFCPSDNSSLTTMKGEVIQLAHV